MVSISQSDYLNILARQRLKDTTVSKAVEEEGELHTQILDECKRRGWLAFHGAMNSKSNRTLGEPDFVILCDRGRFLMVECKTRTGKLSIEQRSIQAWAAKLEHAVHVVRSLEDFLEVITAAGDRPPEKAKT